ncbi:MAG TPA: helix-turn-helix transcriptional regulator [Bacillota bacterium]|nr:helix-turn-helix transcriptional regulator [Bacillota bacterium]
MKIIERIEKLMQGKQITQAEFSRRIGVPVSRVANWRRKGSTPSADLISCIAKVLNVDTHYLLTGEQINGKNFTYELTADEADLVDGYRKLNRTWQRVAMGEVYELVAEVEDEDYFSIDETESDDEEETVEEEKE